MSFEQVLGQIQTLVAIAGALQTIELWQVRDSFSDQGIWRWADLRLDFASAPAGLRLFLDGLFNQKSFLFLLALRFLGFLLLPWSSTPAIIFILLFSSIAIAVRWRGSYNGGSDSMTVLVLLALLVARLFPNDPRVAAGALWYLTLQLILSYFIAGIAKLKEPRWRSGQALIHAMTSGAYQVPAKYKEWALKKHVAPLAAGVLIIFECVFPLALLHPLICFDFLGMAFAFHLLNFAVFGLNRFFWAWLAAYPALVYCCLSLSS